MKLNILLDLSDKTAVGLSFACVMHCIAVPIVLIALPSLSGFFAFDEHFHLWLVFAVIPVSLLAITFGYFNHYNKQLFFISGVGMSMLLAAVVFGHDSLGDVGEIGLTIVGSALIAYCHLRNIALRKRSIHTQ